MNRNIWMLGFCVLSLCGYASLPVYAQESWSEADQPENWEELSGKVENFDLDTSMIVVKVYSGEEKTAYQQVTVQITQEAKIVKDDQVYALKDLRTGDEVSVRYILTANGQKTAYYLWVK